MTKGNPLIVTYTDTENGLSFRRTAVGLPPMPTVAEGDTVLASLKEGTREHTDLARRLYDARNAIGTRVHTQAMGWGDRTLGEVAEAMHDVGTDFADVTRAIDNVATGAMSVEAATDLYDRVVRAQNAIAGRANAWWSGMATHLENLRDPIAAHDRLVNKYRILRTRSVV